MPRCATIDLVECEVAREALSARMDGEREPVPARRVDEHLSSCPDCRQWQAQLDSQMALLRGLISTDRTRMTAVPDAAPTVPVPPARPRIWLRIALGVVGATQIMLALAQGFGADVGTHLGHLAGEHMDHLVHESTAWSAALGVALLAAALRPALAAGVAVLGVVLTVLLTGYVIADGVTGAVGIERMSSHLPALLGTVLALLVWRAATRGPGGTEARVEVDEITLPDNASRGRRRGHLWPTDGAA